MCVCVCNLYLIYVFIIIMTSSIEYIYVITKRKKIIQKEKYKKLRTRKTDASQPLNEIAIKLWKAERERKRMSKRR